MCQTTQWSSSFCLLALRERHRGHTIVLLDALLELANAHMPLFLPLNSVRAARVIQLALSDLPLKKALQLFVPKWKAPRHGQL